MNRGQNVLELLFADISTGTTRTVLTESEDKWVDVTNDLTFLRDGNFIWPSERDGYRHLYLYRNDGTLINQITKGSGKWSSFYGVDEKSGTLYYSSTEVSPLERQIYRIQLDGKKKKRLTEMPAHTQEISPQLPNIFSIPIQIYPLPPKIVPAEQRRDNSLDDRRKQQRGLE